MAKVRERGGSGMLCSALELHLRGRGRVPRSRARLRKIIHEMSTDNLRREMQIGLQLLLLQAVEGQEIAPLGGLALEWAPGTC